MSTPINELRQDNVNKNNDTDLVNGIINELENENNHNPQQVQQPQQYNEENSDDRVEYYPPDEYNETFYQKVIRQIKPALLVSLIIFVLNNAYFQNILTKVPYLANSIGHLNIVGKIVFSLLSALIFLIINMFIN